jgi:hypothetical protein
MTTTGVNAKLQHQQQHSSISLNKKKKKKPLLPWPTRHLLPPLQDSVLQGLKEERLEFPINEACKSQMIITVHFTMHNPLTPVNKRYIHYHCPIGSTRGGWLYRWYTQTF